MKKFLFAVLVVGFMMSQAYGVAVFTENGTSLYKWIQADGQWVVENGAIARVNEQVADHTHGLTIPDAVDLTKLTFPVSLTYDVMVEKEGAGAGEVWSGIGLTTPGANDIEQGAVVVALRDNAGKKGVNFLVGGRQWAQGDANYTWKAGQWYTIRVVLENPNFDKGQIGITASINVRGASEAGFVVSKAVVPADTNSFLLKQTGITLFSRSSKAGLGGKRYYDNIIVEAANVPNGKVVYKNSGTDLTGFKASDTSTWAVVDGAITRTSAQKAGTTHAFVINDIINLKGGAEAVSLEYDVKVEKVATLADETWTGIGLFTPAIGATNIEDGAVIETIRDAGLNGARGLHSLVGGRAWIDNSSPNLMFKANAWYHMSVTISKINATKGLCDISATMYEVGGTGAASVVLHNAPAAQGKTYVLTNKGISLFSRSGKDNEGGTRAFKNIVVTQIPDLDISAVQSSDLLK